MRSLSLSLSLALQGLLSLSLSLSHSLDTVFDPFSQRSLHRRTHADWLYAPTTPALSRH